MRKTISLSLLTVVAVAAALFSMAPASGSAAGLWSQTGSMAEARFRPTAILQQVIPGRIAFSSSRDGNREIYVMNADGSCETRLTNNAGGVSWPAWSPDGSQIAFVSDRDGNKEIYVMDADGSNQVNITNNRAEDVEPAWSPDGSKIAFVSRRGNYDIYVMNADGSNRTRLTKDGAWDVDPTWSPDGLKIAFSSTRDGYGEIYVMDADGSNQINRTNSPAVWDSLPAWSPDGLKIAFRSAGDEDDIYVMDANGSNQINLTNSPAAEQSPAWSPDGSKIAFHANRGNNYNWDIYLMDAATGLNQTRLTNNIASDFSPAWINTAAVALVCPPSGTVTGTVSDSTGPLAGVGLTTNTSQSATTDAGGNYTIDEVPTGSDITVTASLPGYAEQSETVAVNDGGTTSGVDFHLGQGTMLVDSIDVSVSKKGNTQAEASVEIVDQDSNPVLGANVTGDWYLQDTLFSSGAAGTTGYFGYATISSGKIENSSRGDVIKFCVTNVTHDLLSYDPTADIPGPPCGQTTVP